MSDRKEKDKANWMAKKKPIIENIQSAIEFNEKTIRMLSETQVQLNKTRGYLTNNQVKLNQIKTVIGSEAYIPDNPVNESSIRTMTTLSENELGSARYMHSTAGVLRTNADSLEGSVSTSSSIVTGMASSAYYMADRMIDVEPIVGVINELKQPTAQDRLSELSPKLSEIGVDLSTKLNGAWETLDDPSKDDRVSQSAHSARDLISDILIRLAADEKVKEMSWFKPETPNGRPTQRQRAKYAILGENNALTDLDLQPIHHLSDSIRESYESLTELAHLRNYTNDLQKTTESLIDEVQIYLLKLLELRAKYFVE
jgi:hypothetical protein